MFDQFYKKDMFKRILWLCWIAMFFMVQATFAADDDDEKYKRKSISFTNSLFIVGEGINMPTNREGMIVNTLNQAARMERFDYNIIPEEYLTDFRTKMRSIRAASLEEGLPQLGQVLNETLAPPILRIVDQHKELRAVDHMDEAEKELFLTRKEAEFGISRDVILSLMNSAYIYLPFISSYKHETGTYEKKDEPDEPYVKYTIVGGAIFFTIDVDATGKHSVSVMEGTPIVQTHSDSENPNETVRGKSRDQLAFEGAVRDFLGPLNRDIRKLPPFNVSGTVQEVNGRIIGVDVDKSDGLKPGQKIVIFRDVSRSKKEGYAILENIAEEEGGISYARTIIGKPEVGMPYKEFVQVGVELDFKLRLQNPLKVEAYSGDLAPVSWGEIKTTYPALEVNVKYTTVLGLGFLGRRTTQFLIGGRVGVPSVGDANVRINRLDGSAIDYALYVGIERRWRFGRFALGLQPRFGFQGLSLSASSPIVVGDTKTSFTISTCIS